MGRNTVRKNHRSLLFREQPFIEGSEPTTPPTSAPSSLLFREQPFIEGRGRCTRRWW